MQAELLFDARADLGEGALWDERNNVLYWVDINGFKLNILNPATGENTSYNVGQHVGTVVLSESGGIFLAVREGFARFDLETEALEIIADPEPDKSENRFNDGKCDPAGRFWAGTMSMNGQPHQGSLYCLDTDMTVTKKVDDINISNGIVWTSDRKTMYYIDSPPRKVFAYDYDFETGDISNVRVAIQVPEGMGVPDGMAIDSDDTLWIAHYNGGVVIHWNPDTAEVMEIIEVPVSRPTACAFGGDKLDTLYITTAINGLKPEHHAKEPHAGSLFVVQTHVTGTLSHRFKG
jgi:sugar lactone lactonase YvrE